MLISRMMQNEKKFSPQLINSGDIDVPFLFTKNSRRLRVTLDIIARINQFMGLFTMHWQQKKPLPARFFYPSFPYCFLT